MKIKEALHNHVVIKELDYKESKYGNIIISDTGKEKALIGKVVKTGPGIVNLMGVLIPNKVKEGDIVSFPQFGGQKITINRQEYLIYKEQDLFLTLEEENNE